MLGKEQPKTGQATHGFFYVPGMTRSNGIFTTDREGYIFTEFFKILAYEQSLTLPIQVESHPDDAMNEFIRNYDAIAALRDPEGNKIFYSVNYRNELPEDFLERLRIYMRLMPDDTVLWSDDVFNTPQPAPAREVVYGRTPEKPPRKPTRAQLKQKWAHPETLSPEEMNYLSGKSKMPPGGGTGI